MTTFLGHKDRCFDIKIQRHCLSSESDYYLLSSSEDGTSILWLYSPSGTKSRKPLYVFKHSSDSEVLRSIFMNSNEANHDVDISHIPLTICTCGADGIATIWKQQVVSQPHLQSSPLRFINIFQFIHSGDQIYACESIDTNTLLAAAGDALYVWLLNDEKQGSQQQPFLCWKFHDSKYSLHSSCVTGDTAIFTNLDDRQPKIATDSSTNNQNSHFGGDRNLDNVEFLFDVKCNPVNKFHCAIATSESQIHIIDLHSCSRKELPLNGGALPVIADAHLYHQEVLQLTSSSNGLSFSLNRELFKFVTSVSCCLNHKLFVTK